MTTMSPARLRAGERQRRAFAAFDDVRELVDIKALRMSSLGSDPCGADGLDIDFGRADVWHLSANAHRLRLDKALI